MKTSRVMVMSDNLTILEAIHQLATSQSPREYTFTFACSPDNDGLLATDGHRLGLCAIDVRQELPHLLASFDLIISAHCRQIFPAALVGGVRCVNIHPGHNPDNRGWYPQVFSIINGLPLGVTIHEMDDKVDHGPIIAQVRVPLHSWDTSGSAYARILRSEMALLTEHFSTILSGSYQTRSPAGEGTVNWRRDFERLCRLDLAEIGRLGAFLDRLRALTHEGLRNAFYVDPETGRRVFVSVVLEPEGIDETGGQSSPEH